MDNNQYLELFIEESMEHLQILNQNLLALESDTSETEVVNDIFRAAHTLKGMAGTMGFNSIAELTHGMENVLDEVRNGKKQVTSDLLDILFECVDYLEALINDIVEQGKEEQRDIKDLMDKLNAILGNSIQQQISNKSNEGTNQKLDEYHTRAIHEGIKQGLIPYNISITLQSTCMLKAARAYIVFKSLEGLGEIINSTPTAQDIEEEKFDRSFSILLLSTHEKKQILDELNTISELESVTVNELKTGDVHKAKSSQKIDEKHDKDTLQKDTGAGQKNEVSRRTGRSIRVDIERLDSLMNLVSELIIVKNRIQDIEDNKASNIMESIEYLSRVTTDLHDAVMKVRMVPIEMVFNRFPRVVRDLARDTGKNVTLNMSGAETEVDRTIIDEIGDPLIHLIRNAIDHGLEAPQERLNAGKNETGSVGLIAYHDGNNVIIEVKDDGRGIDLEKVADKAVAKGLVSSEKVSQLGEREIIDFMFHPGFSTAQQVSNISGRGVGLDVVKTKIESLGGVVEVETTKGKGSRFIIRLPLTLSIIQALLVEVGGEVYAIPLGSIQEILDIATEDVKLIRKQEVIQYRDALIPLIRLEEKLKTPKVAKEDKDLLTVVIVKKGEKLYALSVGSFIGQQEIVIKPLGKYLSNIKVISGATILGDGEVALILDVNHVA